jgi:hypothetical protein
MRTESHSNGRDARFAELDKLIAQAPPEPQELTEARIRKLLYDFCAESGICTKCQQVAAERGLLCVGCAQRAYVYVKRSRQKRRLATSAV